MPPRSWIQSFGNLLVLTLLVLGVTQVVRANLLEELDASQVLQSASAGNPVASAGSPSAELNTGEGLKSSPDVAVASSGPQPSMGGCYSNGPLLNLAPGAYIQFKVAVPPGFLARLDDTPDGGKVITVISPEPACPKCGLQPYASGGTVTNSFDGSPSPPQGNAVNAKVNIQNYQESGQIQRSSQPALPNYPPQYQNPEQTVSSGQMHMKNSAYRKVQVTGANQVPYPARNAPNFPPPQQQPSFQRVAQQTPPPPPPPMMQRMVRPAPQYQPVSSGQYQQPQYTQTNTVPEYQQPLQQQQQQQLSQFSQQTDTNSFQQQSQFQPQPPSQQVGQPVLQTLEKFHTALRSLDDGEQ